MADDPYPYQPYRGSVAHSTRSISKNFSSKFNWALSSGKVDFEQLDQIYAFEQALKDACETFDKEFSMLIDEDEKQ